jgi:hypothetical protein
VPCTWVFKRFDNPVVSDDTQWRRGEVVHVYPMASLPPNAEENNFSVFLQYYMTDKDSSEVREFMDNWNRDITFEVVNGPDPQGFRRIKSSNQKINQSLTIGGWDQSQADKITTEWNEKYPTANLVTVGFTPKDLLQEGTFTTGQAAEYQEVVHAAGLNVTDRQRIWYLTEAAVQSFESTGGFKTGTAAQLNGSLENGTDS